MRSSIANLKQKLEQNEVDSYGWIQDDEMVADILTKDMKDKFGLNEVVMENRLRCITSDDNKVTAEDGEFVMTRKNYRKSDFTDSFGRTLIIDIKYRSFIKI